MHIQGTLGPTYLTVFDLDGTLLDYDFEETVATADVISELARRSGRREVELAAAYRRAKDDARRLHPSLDQLVCRFCYLCQRCGLPDEAAADLRNQYVRKRLAYCRLLPHGKALLLRFRDVSEALVILTNGQDTLQRQRIRAAGIDEMLARIYTSEQLGIAKPDAAAFLHIEREWQLRRSEWRMVGDDPAVDLATPRILGAATWHMDTLRNALRPW